MCGDTANGFVALWNWGRLGDGTYTAVVYDNGVEFARTTFTVVTPGEEFLFGATGSGTATLSTGQQATLKWSQASQNFVVTNYTNPGGGTPPPPVARGVGQFLGTWQLTNSITTQTYRFPRVEACGEDDSEQCVFDYSQGAVLLPGGSLESIGYSYALIHPDGAICRSYFLYEPTGNSVQGHYGYGFGSYTSDSVIESIATDVALRRYPTTGRRISQSASQTFSLEVEEGMEAEEEVTQEEIEDIETAIKEMLLLMME